MSERKEASGWGPIKVGIYIVLGLVIGLCWILNRAFRAVGEE